MVMVAIKDQDAHKVSTKSDTLDIMQNIAVGCDNREFLMHLQYIKNLLKSRRPDNIPVQEEGVRVCGDESIVGIVISKVDVEWLR